MAALPAPTADNDTGSGGMNRVELRALTSVRGLAAWFVVGFHIRGSIAGLPAGAEAILAKGYLAVDFFFLLSGFVIWLSYAERLRAAGPVGIPDFLLRRLARIWPLHLLMLAAAVALALLLAATGRHDPVRFPFAELPLHVVLVQNWGYTSALSWNDPAWSISCELAAYLAFPLLVAAIDWRRVPSWAIIGAVAGMVTLLHLIFAAQGSATLGTDITRLGLVRCLAEFAVGTAVAALWLRWRDQRGAGVGAAAVAIVSIASWAAGASETLVVPPLLAALLLLLALTSGTRGNPLEGRVLHYLGEISYATYLGHFLLFFAFKLAFVRDANAVPPGLILLYLFMVLISSIALFHGVERPAQRWLNARRAARTPITPSARSARPVPPAMPR